MDILNLIFFSEKIRLVSYRMKCPSLFFVFKKVSFVVVLISASRMKDHLQFAQRGTTFDLRYLEIQGTLRQPYIDISDCRIENK